MSPKIEIKVNGTQAHIFVDGVEVNGVRGYSLEHRAEGERIPVLKLDLVALDCTIDGKGVLPALPEIYKAFYVRKEDSEEEIFSEGNCPQSKGQNPQ